MIKYIIILALLPNIVFSQESKDWVDLFNGKDLSGWDIKFTGYDLNDNLNKTFGVKDGLLSVSYDEWSDFNNEFGHIFYNKPYSHYRLKVIYRFVGDQVTNGPGWAYRNNGVMLHSQSAASMLKDQDFPISLETQLLGGNGKDERPTGNLCTPGTHVNIDGKLVEEHCIISTSKTYHGDQWVEMEILVLGDSLIQHVIDDKVVFTYSKPVIGGGVVANYDDKIKKDGKALTEGYISLQAESHPTQFRSIRLLNLKGCRNKDAANYKDYFVADDPKACVFY